MKIVIQAKDPNGDMLGEFSFTRTGDRLDILGTKHSHSKSSYDLDFGVTMCSKELRHAMLILFADFFATGEED